VNVIYVDIILLENLWMNSIILIGTAICLKRKWKIRKDCSFIICWSDLYNTCLYKSIFCFSNNYIKNTIGLFNDKNCFFSKR